MERCISGCESVEDAAHSGRPFISLPLENIEHASAAIDKDRSSIRESEESRSMPHTTVHEILGDNLGMVRVSAHWLIKLLIEEQAASADL